MSLAALLGGVGTALNSFQAQQEARQKQQLNQIEIARLNLENQHYQQQAQLDSAFAKFDGMQAYAKANPDAPPPDPSMAPHQVTPMGGGPQQGGGQAGPMIPGAQPMQGPPQGGMPGMQGAGNNPLLMGVPPGGGNGMAPQGRGGPPQGMPQGQPQQPQDPMQRLASMQPPTQQSVAQALFQQKVQAGANPQDPALMRYVQQRAPAAYKDAMETYKAQAQQLEAQARIAESMRAHQDTEADRRESMSMRQQFHADTMALAATKSAGSKDSALDDDTVKEMAGQYLAGDKSVLQNLGRGAQGSANIVRLRKEIAAEAAGQNMSPKDIATKMAEFDGQKAGERTLGQRSAQMGMAVDEASRVMPLARQASAAVARTKYVPLNKAIQAVQAGSSDPALARFVAANTSLVNVYARAMSPTGVPTVSDKDHAREMLNTAQSPEAYNAILDQMQAEMEAAQKAPGDVRVELSGKGGGGSTPTGGKDYSHLWSGQ